MTTAVTVSVPEGANYRAKIEHIDQNGDEGVSSLAGTLKPGESSVFYVHSTREVVVSEIPLDD